MKIPPLKEVFALKEVAGRCNCENGGCEELHDHKPGSCKRPAGDLKALYLGSLCDTCAYRMPKEYILTPGGVSAINAQPGVGLEPPRPLSGVDLAKYKKTKKHESMFGGGGMEDGETGENEDVEEYT